MGYSSGVDWPTAMKKLIVQMDALPHGQKKDVAKKLGLSPAQWSQFIRGDRGISPERAHKIAEALGIELNVQFKAPDGKIEE